MKSKISRILGVVLALFMVASTLLLPATTLPVAASPGDTEWYPLETMPTYGSQAALVKRGGSFRDYAISSDSTTIWAIDERGTGAVGASQRVYLSTDKGETFREIPLYPGGAPKAIAVASDNSNAIAVTDGAKVYVASDGGTTWSELPALPAVYAGSVITDIAVGASRSGTLLGREYIITLADPTAGSTARGDVLALGKYADWRSLGLTGPDAPITGTMDYTSVIVSPAFSNDQSVLVVGTGILAGSTKWQVMSVESQRVIHSVAVAGAGATVDYDSTFAAPGSIRFSSIDAPTDFDPMTQTGRTVYVGIGSVTTYTGNDVYRIDDTVPRKLEAVSNMPVASISYRGTVISGTLYMGRAGTAAGGGTDIKRTDNPTSSIPTWVLATKQPGGVANNTATGTFVQMAPDYSKSKRVYATTTATGNGQNNGFYVSTDSGVSFNGEGFINTVAGNHVNSIQEVALTPDGKTFFMATFDNPYLSLWRSGTPITSAKWSRIFSVQSPGSTGVILKLNPEWAKDPAIFVVDKVIGGKIYVSRDDGASWSERALPPGCSPGAFAVRNVNNLYVAEGLVPTENFYKSTNGGWSWSVPVNYKAPIRTGGPDRLPTGVATSMIIPPVEGHIVIGAYNTATISRDDGVTWAGLVLGNETAGAVTVVAHTDYAKNGFVFAGGDNEPIIKRRPMELDPLAPHLVQLWDIAGESPAGNITDFMISQGVLYVLTEGGTYRTLNAADALGTLEWSMMDARLGAGRQLQKLAAAPHPKGGSYLYASYKQDGATRYVAAYNDWLSGTKPVITTPDKYNVPIDPVTGRGDNVQINMKSMGSGQGIVKYLELEINTKETGLLGFMPGTGTGFPFFSGPFVGGVAMGILIDTAHPSFTYGAPGSGATVTGPWVANTEYVYRVRAYNTISGDMTVSPWSDPRTLKVQSGGVVQQPYAGPVLLGPAGGAQNIDPKLVGFSWAPVAGATEYEVKVATDAALTKTVGGTPAKVTIPSYSVANLEFGTTYFWSAQATKPGPGPVSVGTFTTAAKPVPVPTVAPYTPPPPVTPIIQIPPPETPPYIWAVIAIGAVLVIAVIILIVRTRRVP